jgi:hypothetical protein
VPVVDKLYKRKTIGSLGTKVKYPPVTTFVYYDRIPWTNGLLQFVFDGNHHWSKKRYLNTTKDPGANADFVLLEMAARHVQERLEAVIDERKKKAKV